MTDSVITTMGRAISAFMEIFTTLFTETFDLILGNWYFLILIGVPLVSGIVFSIISVFRSN